MSRSYSYSPSPTRNYRRRGRSRSPEERYGRRRDLPTSLLVRNLRLDCRPDDLRKPFAEFGPLKDIYLPRDYYTGEPRGFGFVQFIDPHDAADAKYQMDGEILRGRELTVVFAEENRKRPADMRKRDRLSGGSYGYRRSSTRHSYSRSRSPRYSRSRSSSPSYSHSRRRYSRSRSSSPSYSRSRSRGSSSRHVRRVSRDPSYSRSVSPNDQKHQESRSPRRNRAHRKRSLSDSPSSYSSRSRTRRSH